LVKPTGAQHAPVGFRVWFQSRRIQVSPLCLRTLLWKMSTALSMMPTTTLPGGVGRSAALHDVGARISGTLLLSIGDSRPPSA
jgi:hypothetical protein